MKSRSLQASIRRFLWSEEIPRGLGMCLVLIYLGGLWAVSYTAMIRYRADARETALQVIDDSFALAASYLETTTGDDLTELQRNTRRCGGSHPWEDYVVLDRERKVVASLLPGRVGRPAPLVRKDADPWPTEFTQELVITDSGREMLWLRTPLVMHDADAADIAQPQQSQFLLEGRIDPAAFAKNEPLIYSWILLVVLGCAGALFIVYRTLRRHLRPASTIADYLVENADRLESEISALRVADTMGQVGRAWNQLIDVIETLRQAARQNRASEELQASLERRSFSELADAVSVIPDGIIHIVSGGRIAYANALGARLLHYNAESPPPLGIMSVNAPPLAAAIADVIRSARGKGDRFEAVTKTIEVEGPEGGAYRVRVIPTHQKERPDCCVAVISDVSQHILANKGRDHFISRVSHELRTPLTNIRAYAETLSSGVLDDPATIRECYNVITKETRRLSRLVEDMLNLAQIDAGALRLTYDDVNLMELLTAAVNDLRGLAEERGIDLRTSLPAKMPPIRADRDKLSVVIINLLGNALKYTPSGGQVAVGCRTVGAMVEISVRDTGIGIDPSEHERVFEKFHRSSDPAVQDQEGTGIGLTTAREIARGHGGDIVLVSRKGEGSTFTVTVPLKQTTERDKA